MNCNWTFLLVVQTLEQHASSPPTGLTKVKTCITPTPDQLSTHHEGFWTHPALHRWGFHPPKSSAHTSASKQGIGFQRCLWKTELSLSCFWHEKHCNHQKQNSKGLNYLENVGAYLTPHLLRKQCTSPWMMDTGESGPKLFWDRTFCTPSNTYLKVMVPAACVAELDKGTQFKWLRSCKLQKGT